MENNLRNPTKEIQKHQRAIEQKKERIIFHNLKPSTKLDKDSYPEWRKQVIRILRSYEIEGFVSSEMLCSMRLNQDGSINKNYK